MDGLIAIAVSAALTQNIVLMQLIGVCPAMAASQRTDLALTHACTSGAVIVPVALIAWSLEHLLLIPADASSLRLLVHVPLIVAATRVAMQVLARRMPVQAERIAAHPALLGINCLLLAAVWLSVVDAGSFGEVLARAAGIAAGYVLAALVLARLQTRLATAPVPDVLRGPAIALITAGIASLALLGLAGQVSSP